jgi:hypothetical protein
VFLRPFHFLALQTPKPDVKKPTWATEKSRKETNMKKAMVVFAMFALAVPPVPGPGQYHDH